MLDLTNAAHWVEIYNQIHYAQVVIPGKSVIPIPPIEIPGTFQAPFLNAVAESQTARHWWRLGGYLYQVIDVPGSPFLDMNGFKHFVPLNEARLIQMPDLNCPYRLRFECPYWHEEISLSVWQYTGPVPTLSVLTL